MAEIDHILWAVPDLDAGSSLFERMTGVVPERGGVHPGFGTRNGLVALGDDLYLEIISLDPEQASASGRGREIAALPHPGLWTFAVGFGDLVKMRVMAERAARYAHRRRARARSAGNDLRLSAPRGHS